MSTPRPLNPKLYNPKLLGISMSLSGCQTGGKSLGDVGLGLSLLLNPAPEIARWPKKSGADGIPEPLLNPQPHPVIVFFGGAQKA